MIKGLKICGISDPKTLNYIVNHPKPPNFIGFITNYEKSKRHVRYEKLQKLVNTSDIIFHCAGENRAKLKCLLGNFKLTITGKHNLYFPA